MKDQQQIERFVEIAEGAGAVIVPVDSITAAVDYLAQQVTGTILVPAFASGRRCRIAEALKSAGVDVVSEGFRVNAEQAEAGLTGVNFAIADTGSLALDSTDEDIRLATTLPVKHLPCSIRIRLLPMVWKRLSDAPDARA